MNLSILIPGLVKRLQWVCDYKYKRVRNRDVEMRWIASAVGERTEFCPATAIQQGADQGSGRGDRRARSKLRKALVHPLFNSTKTPVSCSGYDGAGFDINATYIRFKYSGDKDTIAIDLPSDVVFLEWQIFSSPSSSAQPTFSGGDYFVFQDANGQDIANYPLEPGNRSLKSYGLLKSQKPSVDVNNFYSLVPTDSAQNGSTFKIDEETSSSNFLSGSTDKDGCNISYLLGVTY
ncbi:hypothetical protein [Synechococcus sp.]|uniref:hypothetical protein n=1 Tax=Synechococcus sp. TaxID=1131 RepID=UPI0034A3FF35